MDKISDLVHSWKVSKERESEWNAKRISTEKQILALMPKLDEGTETVVADRLKLKVQYALTRTVDEKKYEQLVQPVLDPSLDPFYRKSEVAIDMKKLRAIEELHPDLMKVIGQAITIKPKKPSFTVEEIEGAN